MAMYQLVPVGQAVEDFTKIFFFFLVVILIVVVINAIKRARRHKDGWWR